MPSRRPRTPDPTQLPLFRDQDPRGGYREGSGRKPVIPGRQAHEARPPHAKRFPLHVTLKVLRDLPRLRQRHLHRALRQAFRDGAHRETFRMVQYSVQGNHLHLLCEAEDSRSLSRGMQGLAIRIARGLNKALERKGKVFFDRYFAREVRNPSQTRRALVYVLNNFLKHERNVERIHGPVDPFSSAACFDGWRSRLPPSVKLDGGGRVCPPAQTWLLTAGWHRQGGKLRFGERPAERL